MNSSIDQIVYRGKPHLSRHQGPFAFCGKTAPFWYRVAWNGASKGICKNCIKKLPEHVAKENTDE